MDFDVAEIEEIRYIKRKKENKETTDRQTQHLNSSRNSSASSSGCGCCFIRVLLSSISNKSQTGRRMILLTKISVAVYGAPRPTNRSYPSNYYYLLLLLLLLFFNIIISKITFQSLEFRSKMILITMISIFQISSL